MRKALPLTMLLLAAVSTPALSQPVADAKAGAAWLSFAIAIGLMVLIAVGSFMSSRRGHQD